MLGRIMLGVAIVLAVGCTKNPQLIETTRPSASVSPLQVSVEKVVTLSGVLSLLGKESAFVSTQDGQIYLIPDGSFLWDEPYASMEGKRVRVTGTLHFRRFDRSTAPSASQMAPDYFYMDLPKTRVELQDN